MDSKQFSVSRLKDANEQKQTSRKGKRGIQPILRTHESDLPKDSRALCDQVRTIDKGRVQRTVRILSRETMATLDRDLVLHLKLEDYLKF